MLAILTRIEIRETAILLLQADRFTLVLASSLVVPIFFFRTYRWYVLLHCQGIKMPFFRIVAISAISIAAGALTPGRVGEFAKVFYVQRYGFPVGRALSSVLVDRILDMAFLAAIGLLAAMYFFGFQKLHSLVLATTVAMCLLFGLFPALIRLGWNSRNGMAKLLPQRFVNLIGNNAKDIAAGLSSILGTPLFLACLMTLLSWGLTYWAIYLCSNAIDLHLSFLFVSGASALCALVTMLPVSVMGIGTRDAMLIIIFRHVGHAEIAAVAFSSLILFLTILNAIVCSTAFLTSDLYPAPSQGNYPPEDV